MKMSWVGNFRMTMSFGKRAQAGFVLPLVILGLISLFLLVTVLSNMSSEYSNQVAHGDEVNRCRLIAESAYSIVLAKVRERPWGQRFFSPRFEEFGTQLYGGEYDLYIEDTPGKSNQADVYVRATFRRTKRLLFWRFVFEDTVLDAVGKMYPLLFTSFDVSRFPDKVQGSPFLEEIENIIEERKRNNGPAKSKAQEIRNHSSLKEVLGILTIPPSDKVDENVDPAPVPPVPSIKPPEKPVPKLVYQNDFESMTPGTRPPGWSIWFDGHDQENRSGVSTEVSAGGSRADKLSGSGCFKRVEALGAGLDFSRPVTVEADICCPEVNGLKGGMIGFGVKLPFDFAIKNAVSFDRDGNIGFYGKNGFTRFCPYTPGRFYKVRIEVDFESETADVFIDGAKVGEQIEAFPRSIPEGTLNQVVFSTQFFVLDSDPKAFQQTAVYFDNVNIYN